MNILAVGAHPDDIELGCFGTLSSYRSKNHNIFAAIITNGELASNPDLRKEEAKQAAKLIDMKLFLLRAKEDLPEPESPVMTVSLSRGMSISIFLRLWVRA